MAQDGEKAGLAAAVAYCMADQDQLKDEAERESMSDLFGEVVPPRAPGRPAGAMNRATAQEVAAIRASGQSPLGFLSSIWRDPMKPLDKRLTAAIAALPYVHKKLPVDLNVSTESLTVILGGGEDEPETAADAPADVIDGDFEEVSE